MATLDGGDQDCTTGIAKAVYDQVLADTRNGFSSPLATAQDGSVKALVWSQVKGLVDAINAAGGVGAAPEGVFGIFAWNPAADWDDVDAGLVRMPDFKIGASTLKGPVLFSAMIEAVSGINAGTLIGTIPTGFRPAYPVRAFAVQDPVTLSSVLDIRIDGQGRVYTINGFAAGAYYYLNTTFQAA